MSDEASKPKFIVTSAVKALVKDLNNQSGPGFLTALDASVSATVRKACSDTGPNKRLDETSILGGTTAKPMDLDKSHEKLREMRDTAAIALLQVNMVTKNEYIKFFRTVLETTEQLLNQKT
jgi:hypothetical protein